MRTNLTSLELNNVKITDIGLTLKTSVEKSYHPGISQSRVHTGTYKSLYETDNQGQKHTSIYPGLF